MTAGRGPDGRFLPGKSGNPGGRTPVDPDVKQLAAQHGPRAFERVVELMGSKDESISLSAAKVILDRAYGRTPEPLAIDLSLHNRTHEEWLEYLDYDGSSESPVRPEYPYSAAARSS